MSDKTGLAIEDAFADGAQIFDHGGHYHRLGLADGQTECFVEIATVKHHSGGAQLLDQFRLGHRSAQPHALAIHRPGAVQNRLHFPGLGFADMAVGGDA